MAYMEKDVSDLLAAMDASFDEETGDWRECDELAFHQLADECVRPKLERMQKARVALAGDIAAVDAEINKTASRTKEIVAEKRRPIGKSYSFRFKRRI